MGRLIPQCALLQIDLRAVLCWSDCPSNLHKFAVTERAELRVPFKPKSAFDRVCSILEERHPDIDTNYCAFRVDQLSLFIGHKSIGLQCRSAFV